MTAVLEAHGYGKRYRGRPWALRGLDLAVPEGSITALVGPNGSGKSTLIRGWIGFEPPTEGRLSIAGIDPQRHRKTAVMRSGYVPQQPALYRELTVAEHIELAITFRPSFDADLARQYVERLGIPLAAQANQLSGGEQAQVGLALALGTRARILLLDEPLASLDPLARREFLGTVAEAVAGGTTVLLSSHVVGDLDEVCDRLIVLAPARVQLDAEMSWARAHHRLVPLADAGGLDVVGSFANRRGVHTALVRTEEPVAEPTRLDDIVLGYLAAGRRPGAAA